MEQNKQKQRPLIAVVDIAKKELIQCVNNIVQQGVPCYFLESILTDILMQVKSEAQNELAQAMAQMSVPEEQVEE